MDLSGARVGVTGAAGFIGRGVSRRLVSEGATVVGLDRADPDRVAATGAEPRPCDVTDARAVARALTGCTHVVHTAALVTDWGPMRDFVAVNVRGTRNVLDAAAEHGVERVVHLSSVAAWGYEFRHDLAEDATPRPCGVPYIDTKAASDVLARRRGAAVVRPGDVYGPESAPWIVRPLEALRRGRFRLPAPGDGVMTPVYVDDLVDCVVRALATPGMDGEAVVAWDGRPVSAADFFAHHARMLGLDRVPTLPAPVVVAVAAVQEAVARVTGRPPDFSRNALAFITRRAAYPNARARELLGWEPQVDLEEGMRRSEHWLREEGLLT